MLNNPLRYTDPNGDTVKIDPQLVKPLNMQNFANFTNSEKQTYYFQQWWNENGGDINKLFEIGGKYESTNINFVLGTQSSKREFAIALPTFGSQDMKDEDLFRGGSEVKPNYGIDNLQFKIWFNPRLKSNMNTPSHEWSHVRIIFDAVQNKRIVPAAGYYDGSQKGTQHWMIIRGLIPEIK